MKKIITIILTFVIFLTPNKAVSAEGGATLNVDIGYSNGESLDISERYAINNKINDEVIIRKVNKPKVKGTSLNLGEVKVFYTLDSFNQKNTVVKGVKEVSVIEKDDFFEILITPSEKEKIRSITINYKIIYPYERGKDLIFYRSRLYDNTSNTIKLNELNLHVSDNFINNLWVPSGNLESINGNGFIDFNFNMSKSDVAEIVMGVKGYSVERTPISINENMIPKFEGSYGKNLYEKKEEVKLEDKSIKVMDYGAYIVLVIIIIIIGIPLAAYLKKKYMMNKASKGGKVYINKSGIVGISNEVGMINNNGIHINRKINPILLGMIFDKSEDEILKIALMECMRKELMIIDNKNNLICNVTKSKELENEFVKIFLQEDSRLKGINSFEEIIDRLSDNEKNLFIGLCNKNLIKVIGEELDMENTYEYEMKRRAIFPTDWLKIRDNIAMSRGKYEELTPVGELKKIYIYCYAIGIPTNKLPNLDKKELMKESDKKLFREFNSIIK